MCDRLAATASGLVPISAGALDCAVRAIQHSLEPVLLLGPGPVAQVSVSRLNGLHSRNYTWASVALPAASSSWCLRMDASPLYLTGLLLTEEAEERMRPNDPLGSRTTLAFRGAGGPALWLFTFKMNQGKLPPQQAHCYPTFPKGCQKLEICGCGDQLQM